MAGKPEKRRIAARHRPIGAVVLFDKLTFSHVCYMVRNFASASGRQVASAPRRVERLNCIKALADLRSEGFVLRQVPASSILNLVGSLHAVKAAVRPVLLMASRLSAGLPPPVAGSSEVNSKLVGVERAARATLDTQVDPPIQDSGLNSPWLRTPSAVFK